LTALDIDYVRRQFPALADGYGYLDNAGGSAVLKPVAERMSHYLLNHAVQLGASYAPSVQAGEKVLEARASVAQLINARHSEECVMAGSTTLLLQLLARAIAPSIGAGDEIIVTHTDHEANIGPWQRLCEERGATLRVWSVDPSSLELELHDLQALLGPRTRYVAMTHASNILGSVNPVAQVAERVHACGAKLVVDAVAYAPHRLVDVQASGADYYVFSFYKVFGPHFAVLWGKRELLLELPSLNRPGRAAVQTAAGQRQLRVVLWLHGHQRLPAGHRPSPGRRRQRAADHAGGLRCVRSAGERAGRDSAGLSARGRRRAHHRQAARHRR